MEKSCYTMRNYGNAEWPYWIFDTNGYKMIENDW